MKHNSSLSSVALILLLSICLNTMETQAQSVVSGEYYFGRQELASGFRFNTDGTFEFFYSYGASDRTANGTYTISGDTIKLKSDKEPGKDVVINKESKQGKGYIIQCKAPNKEILSYMQCIVVNGDQKDVFEANNEGIIKIDQERCDKIYVSCLMFPDIPTLIKDESNSHNRFEVTLLPIVQQVSFKGIDFKIEDDSSISCYPNYIFMMENIRFRKQ